ncbi:MAG: hypothetical protein AMXMBFR46_19780 [Acidimicrobiia bacterium]
MTVRRWLVRHVLAVSVAAGSTTLVLPAGAQTPPTGSRSPVTLVPATTGRGTPPSTPPSFDDPAERAGLLITADLPPGYAIDKVRTEIGRPVSTLVVDDCEMGSEAFDGKPPTLATEVFANAITRSGGAENLFTFPSTDTAHDYYGEYAEGLSDLTKCNRALAPDGTIGTFTKLKLPKVGNERKGLTFTPSATGSTPVRLALVRAGTKTIYLELTDRSATDDAFGDLVKAAEKRAR